MKFKNRTTGTGEFLSIPVIMFILLWGITSMAVVVVWSATTPTRATPKRAIGVYSIWDKHKML
jgi:hypothetical protein